MSWFFYYVDLYLDLAVVIDSSLYQGASGLSPTSSSDFQQVKNFINSLNFLLANGSSGMYEAVIDYKDGISNKQLPANLSPLDAANLKTIINNIPGGSSLNRSYTSAFERLRDNVFCFNTQCGDRSSASNVVLFFAGGQPTVRLLETQGVVNNVKARNGRSVFIITVGVGPMQVTSLIKTYLTDYATCSVNAFFSTAGSLQGILNSVYNTIANEVPRPLFNNISSSYRIVMFILNYYII